MAFETVKELLYNNGRKDYLWYLIMVTTYVINRQLHRFLCNPGIIINIVHATVEIAFSFASSNYLSVTGTIIPELHYQKKYMYVCTVYVFDENLTFEPFLPFVTN